MTVKIVIGDSLLTVLVTVYKCHKKSFVEKKN